MIYLSQIFLILLSCIVNIVLLMNDWVRFVSIFDVAMAPKYSGLFIIFNMECDK